MRKFTYIFMIAIMMLLAGCGSAVETVAEPAVEAEPLPAMGEVHITAALEPGAEYQPARVSCLSGDMMNAEIKLRGNSSREVDKKAYTLKFEDECSFLGMDDGRKWALVSNPFDKTLLRPAVGLTYAKALGIEYTPDFRLCKVYLNGIYMGVYTAMEPVEMGNGRVEIDTDRGDFLLERNLNRYEEDKTYIDSSLGLRFEFNEPEEPDKSQIELCGKLLQQTEEAICSGDHLQYEKYIDVDSFVNFYVFHEIIKDIDFGEYSTRYYFEDGVLHVGPPWDLDLTMGNVSPEKEEYKYAAYNNVAGSGDETCDSSRGLWVSSSDYYYWLCRDPWFIEKIRQRWQAVFYVTENLAIANELGDSVINQYLTAYKAELESNFSGGPEDADHSWTIDEPAHMSEWQQPADTYAGNVELLRTWLIKRAAYLDTQFGIFIFTPALAVQ